MLFLFLAVGIGYSYLNTNLNITGNTTVAKNSWDVHFENVKIESDSTITTLPTINNAKDLVSFTVSLEQPGDIYHFTVDIKNAGTINAMISVFNNSTLTANQQKYLEYTVMYQNGANITKYDLLSAGKSQKLEVFLKYKDDISAEDLANSQDENLTLSFTTNYIQADSNAQTVTAPSFSDSSWETIIKNVKNGDTSSYHVGDIKTINLGSLGTHTLRIANMSTPAECSTNGFSQTACGFVVEFTESLGTHFMNSSSTNSGSWPTSEMRTYIQNSIYPLLQSEMHDNIIDTMTVSGHGSGESTNYVSNDYLYLFSPKEIWGESTSNDSAQNLTRQLDYYQMKGVTSTNYSAVIKDSSCKGWYLRTPVSYTTFGFWHVSQNGDAQATGATIDYCIIPAFRIG